MQMDEAPSPLTMAAKLLMDHGAGAHSEVLAQFSKCAEYGDAVASVFWVQTLIEVIDALDSTTGGLPE